MPDAVAVPVPPRIAIVVRVMVPDAVAAPLLLTNEPLTVNSSAVVNPFKSTVAPDEMEVAVVVPNASLLPNLNVPAVTAVVPLYVFTPVKIQVPVPDLVNVPMPLTMPDAVAIPAPVPPKMAALVRLIAPDAVAAVALLFTNEPLTVNGSAVVNPFKSTVVPNAIDVDPDAFPKAVLLPSINEPAFNVVAPVYRFAPDKVSARVPFLIRESCPLPSLMTPECRQPFPP